MAVDRTCRSSRTAAAVALCGMALACGPGSDSVGLASQSLVWTARSVDTPSAVACAPSDDVRVLGMRGDALVVGAPGHCVGGATRGAVSILDRSGLRWLETGLLLRPGGAGAERFGASIAMSEAVLAVGAPSAGIVEIFERVGLRFVSVASFTVDGRHGASLASDDATVVAGAPDATVATVATGSVYVYERSIEGGWSLAQVLAPDAPAAGGQLGRAVALDGDLLAIGSAAGVAVLTRRGPSDPFGASANVATGAPDGLAMSGGTLVVVSAGAVSLHVFDGVSWSTQPTPTGLSGTPRGPIALAGRRMAVATSAGVFVSERGASTWGAFLRVGGAASDAVSLAIDPLEVVVANAAGHVSAYQRVGGLGEGCAAAVGCESGFCVDGVCCESACGSGATDCLACSVAAGSTTDGTCERASADAECRAATGACDRAESCNGVSDACPDDRLAPVGTACRDAMGSCDVGETCSGTSPYCPEDAFERVGVPCRAAAGECDVPEVCNGLATECPGDRWRPAGTVCRDRAGECDVEEVCDGAGARCPGDTFARFGFVCRAASGQCDADEICDGSSASCPLDALAADDTECADGDACTMGDHCSAGRCVSGPRMCVPPPVRDAGVGGGGGHGGCAVSRRTDAAIPFALVMAALLLARRRARASRPTGASR